jgi:hypothetical protein
MKLIRLTTENENALFDNTFNEDLIIPPNSRICLQSLSTQINKDILEINAQNNTIEFTLDGEVEGSSEYFTIYLEHGVYDSSNIGDFLQDFTDKLNGAMSGSTSATLGKQWLVALKGNRVEIQCVRGTVLTFDITTITSRFFRDTNTTLEPLGGNSYYEHRTGGTVNTNDAFFYSLQPCNKGASSLRCQLRSNSGNSGFILGYVSTPPNAVDTVGYNTLSCAIEFVNETSEYKVYYNGNQIPNDQLLSHTDATIVGPGDPGNDILCIDISPLDPQGVPHVQYYILRNGVRINLYDVEYSLVANNLFMVGVCRGDTTVWNLQNTTDPYYVINDNAIKYKKPASLTSFGVPIATGEFKSDTYFSINSTELATALGFKQNKFPIQLNPPTINYTYQDNISLLADYAFFLKFNSDSYIVELLNLKINSMDALSNQHKNFLAVIPHNDTIVERVSYIAPVLIFIDLNNKEQINLRQIKARIIQQDLSPIFCYGMSQLVLLVE